MLYTTKEIGEALGVSKSTARRYLQRIGARPVHDLDQGDPRVNRYESKVLKDIQKIIDSGSIHESSHEPDHSAINESMYDALVKQLEAKDKQIEELMKALDQEQQLNAMAESRILQLEAEPQEKPSFWKRIRDAVRG